jgi:hypothetical protein
LLFCKLMMIRCRDRRLRVVHCGCLLAGPWRRMRRPKCLIRNVRARRRFCEPPRRSQRTMSKNFRIGDRGHPL